MTNSHYYGNLLSLLMCILHLRENGMKQHRLAQKYEPCKIGNLFMDHPVGTWKIIPVGRLCGRRMADRR